MISNWHRHEMGFLEGPVGAIAGAVGGAASSAAGALGGIAGAVEGISGIAGSIGGSGMGGGGAGSTYAQQVQMALLANEQRKAISDDYFDRLIGRRVTGKGKNRKVRYGSRNELLMGQDPKKLFGTRPQYIPVDFETMLDQDPGFADISGDVTRGNLQNFGLTSQLAGQVNQFLTQDAINRVNAFDPLLMDNIQATGRAAQLASQGILPASDREQIVGAANERASLFGTPGTSRGQVARDLGLTQLDLQTRIAPQLTQTNTALINAIAPPQMRDDPRSREVSIGQAIQVGAADNQFEAQFDRREQNLRSLLASIPDPRSQGIFSLQNALRAQKFMIDFGLANGLGMPGTMPENLGQEGAQGFMSTIGAVGGAMQSLGSIFGGGGGYGGGFGTPGIFG